MSHNTLVVFLFLSPFWKQKVWQFDQRGDLVEVRMVTALGSLLGDALRSQLGDKRAELHGLRLPGIWGKGRLLHMPSESLKSWPEEGLTQHCL